MNDTCGFVHDAEPLKKIESHRRIIVSIMQQTTECGYFIRDYSKNKDFCMFAHLYLKLITSHDNLFSPGKRTMKNLISVVDNKVEQFLAKFSELKLALQERAVVETEITVFKIEITVLRVLETVENIS
jgi:hypothetical protein